jgi:BirA family transcriptional regulator, biotin operon repressor / biotin---[acetyl-CoA-carboxylase] ligase
MLNRLLDRLRSMPEPESWQAIEPVWKLFDATPGKLYKLPTGEESVAMGVGPSGELLCAVEGESTTVMAADALFGQLTPTA